jgi:NAD(P)H-hydrate epimerase
MDLTRFYPRRRGNERKGDFGHVLVAGGSERYAGAPAFNALAALRAGADLATLVAPRRAADIAASYAPDLITVPCDSPFPTPALVQGLQERCDALVLGGGVERTAIAHEAMRHIAREWTKPMVLDAEALHAVKPDLLRGKRAILTPHGGEFAVLAGEAWPPELEARKAACMAAARRWGATLIVKGARDIISDGERVHVDEHGSPYMTKGGHGDLLAGVAGALLARKAAPFDAACGAAAILGRAGALAGARHGEALLASDTLASIGEALPQTSRVD